MNEKNCCCKNLHPCCVKYWDSKKCPCCCPDSACPPNSSGGCELGPFPLACSNPPPLQNPVIAQWFFENGGDAVAPLADVGSGIAELQGAITGAFAEDVAGNKYWKTNNYPEQLLDSGTSGVRFNASTELEAENPTVTGIRFSFKLLVTPASSAWFLVQYTTNGGSTWRMAKPVTKIVPNFSVNFSYWYPVAGTINDQEALYNPNFALRVVSVFSPEDFTELHSGTFFLANQAYESCLNFTGSGSGGVTPLPYLPIGVWGFDDVSIEFISIAILTIPSCQEYRFIKSESGCFETEEDCIEYFKHLEVTEIEFFEDVNCDGESIPESDPRLPEDFCEVPPAKNLIPQYYCGCCGPTIQCCTLVDNYDSNEEGGIDIEVPNCPPQECCDPPEPKYCCCITVSDSGCSQTNRCTSFVPGLIIGQDQCSDLAIIAPGIQEYCVEVPSCDYCDPNPGNCYVGIQFKCVNTCLTISCSFGDSGCGDPSGPNCFTETNSGACDITLRCRDPQDPNNASASVECCSWCEPECPGSGMPYCCTAACSEELGSPLPPCTSDLCPPSYCGEPCIFDSWPKLGNVIVDRPCDICESRSTGLCFVGNCPTWVYNLNTMNFEATDVGEDLTKGILFDTNQKQILSDTFFFGYGERFL